MIECPKCRSLIPPMDFNVSTDIAYCRSCDLNHKYSALVHDESLPDLAKVEVPKYVQVDDQGGRIEIIYRRLHPILLFLVPFTMLWSGLSLTGIYGAQLWKGKFDLEQSLFGIPFVIGTLILVSVCLYLLFGKWRITLDGPESRVFAGIGFLGWTRPFDLTTVQHVHLTPGKSSVNDVPLLDIVIIDKEDTEFHFGSTIHEESKSYIAAIIKKQIRR